MNYFRFKLASLNLTSLSKQEKGGIAILAAIILIAIFSMAALAIDLTMNVASTEEERNNAKLAVIAALNAYQKSDQTLSESKRLAIALQRANDVSGLNTVFRYGQGNNTADTISSADGSAIQIIPGKWYRDITYTSNPCQSGDTPPCFVPVNPSAGEKSNAFRVTGNLYQGSSSVFSNIAGFNTSMDSTVDITVATNVRYGCFAVDLSSSLIRDTHPIIQVNPDGTLKENSLAFDMTYAPQADSYNSLAATRSGATDPTVHFQDDYQSVTTYTDTDYNPAVHQGKHPDPSVMTQFSTAPIEGTYLLDTFRDSTYTGPEPLNTVFTGLQAAAQLFKDRAVAGDKMCVIFYDSVLTWPRVITLTDDFDYVLSLTDTTPYDLDNDGVLDTNKGLGLLAKHGLFPAPAANTASMLAINEAMRQFYAANNGDPSFWTSNFIMMIGDGLTNCSACPTLDPNLHDFTSLGSPTKDGIDSTDLSALNDCLTSGFAQYSAYQISNNINICDYKSNLDVDGDGVVTQADYDYMNDVINNNANGYCTVSGCTNDYPHYRNAIGAVTRFAEYTAFKNAHIPIHVAMIGPHVGPHTIDYISQSAPPGCTTSSCCMSDSEARTLDKEFVRGGDKTGLKWQHTDDNNTDQIKRFSKMSAKKPYFTASLDWYKIATMTGGIWAPIRPPADPSEPKCNPSGTYEEDANRRRTDALGRSTAQQIQGYMKDVMKDNPFVIVDVK